MIKKEVIDEILARNDIESLIGSYIALKRAGSNLKGLCPFHNEKTPSFTVYPADNSFYCFGCGVGGNAITFVRQMEHLDYRDAVEFLARRAGVSVILDSDDKYLTKRVDKNRFYSMNVDAAKFFHLSLFANDTKAREALSYFTEKRGLSLATIKHFGLGFAPDSFDALLNYMTKKGYSKEELTTAFLIGKSERGHYYDAFRNRVMFPIIDVSGNVIAFGGRVMDDSKPKYKNTMDTPIFKKSRNLFALNFAKNSEEDALILCEGYMDVIALHAAGFTNAVATLGTAITSEQARLMSRYSKKVLVSYDADEAGQKAAQKAIRLLDEVGIEVSIIKVPGAKDPDEYIKTFGKEKFKDVISNSKSKFEYNMDSVLSRYDINIPQDKINALNELEKMLSRVYLKAERDIYIQALAEKFGVDQRSIRDDVERLSRIELSKQRKTESDKLKQKSAGYSDRINPDFAKSPAIAKCEESILGMLLGYPEHRKKVFGDKLLTEEDFFTEFNRRVFSFIRRCFEDSGDGLDDFNEHFLPEECGRIKGMQTSRLGLDNGEAVLREAVDALKTMMDKKKAESTSSVEELAKRISMMQNKNKEN